MASDRIKAYKVRWRIKKKCESKSMELLASYTLVIVLIKRLTMAYIWIKDIILGGISYLAMRYRIRWVVIQHFIKCGTDYLVCFN